MKKTAVPFPRPAASRYNAEKEKDANVIGRRIAEARKRKGLSIAAFSEFLENYGINISTGGAGKWETGYSIPNAYQLIAICNALDIDDQLPYFTQNYSPELNAEGERKLQDYKEDLIATGKYAPAPEPVPFIRRIDQRVYDLPASAGCGQFLDEGYYELVSFPENMVPDRADFGIRVSGDSMEPVYHDGQIVWVQETPRLYPGEVGIFVCDGQGFIKVYQEQDPEENVKEEYMDHDGNLHPQPVLVSLNEKYADRVISPYSSFRVVGRVL